LAASQEAAPELRKRARSTIWPGATAQKLSLTGWARGRGGRVGSCSTFVGGGLDLEWLEKLTSRLPVDDHADALGWLEARLNLKSLVGQVDQSTERIAELVKAVKAYSYMDQSPMQEVDVHAGLESTLTMLGHKLKNVTWCGPSIARCRGSWLMGAN